MKRALSKVATATLLLANVALAQPAPKIPLGKMRPPKYSLQLNNASVDDALFAVAKAGNVNIIADATDWPDDNKTITADNSDSTGGWLLSIANQFDLTINADGRGHMTQMGGFSKNYVFWKEPDIEPILQQARQMYVPLVVPNDEEGKPIVKPENMSLFTYTVYLLKWQREAATQEITKWLKEQGIDNKTIRAPRDIPAAELPADLRATLRKLARVTKSNTDYERTNVLKQLDDDFWQKARLIYRDVPREKYSFFSAESELEGQPVSIPLIGFFPDGTKVGAR